MIIDGKLRFTKRKDGSVGSPAIIEFPLIPAIKTTSILSWRNSRALYYTNVQDGDTFHIVNSVDPLIIRLSTRPGSGINIDSYEACIPSDVTFQILLPVMTYPIARMVIYNSIYTERGR